MLNTVPTNIFINFELLKYSMEPESKGNKKNVETKLRYTFEEDMAIVNYMTTDKRYLKASGIQVWKEAEKLQICPGRPYLSLKERYRKVIIKNLKKYNVNVELALKIIQFSRANSNGKRTIRLKQSSEV